MADPSDLQASQASRAKPPARIEHRRRMLAADRKEHILREATSYFAEFGLSAGTIELAKRIGITQPLLYKYFETKEILLVAVYERLFPQNWDPSLEALLEDEGIPVAERLTAFYQSFARQVLTYEHVRLFLFSGLTNSALNAHYYSILGERVFTRIVKALRRSYATGSRPGPISHAELELVQALHAAVYHIAFRRWLHGLSVCGNLDELIAQKVRIFLGGASQEMAAMAARKRKPGRAPTPARAATPQAKRQPRLLKRSKAAV